MWQFIYVQNVTIGDVQLDKWSQGKADKMALFNETSMKIYPYSVLLSKIKIHWKCKIKWEALYLLLALPIPYQTTKIIFSPTSRSVIFAASPFWRREAFQ